MLEKITPIDTKVFKDISEYNANGFRTENFCKVNHSLPKILTLGCSHTEGISIAKQDSWPEQLKSIIEVPQLFNLGQNSASIDYIHRIIPHCLDYFCPDYIFILCPSYLRFEYTDPNGVIRQSLPTNPNRIMFMETHNEEWCQTNYEKKLNEIKTLCKNKNIPIFYLTTDDLHSVIDHGDRWILASDKVHFDKNWHRIVAEIFRYKFIARHLYD